MNYNTKKQELARILLLALKEYSAYTDKEIKNQDIKKVFSIRICFTPNEKNKNTISRYKITKEDVFGVCNYSEYILEKEIEQGIEQGIKKAGLMRIGL